jgi:hypothetical protein
MINSTIMYGLRPQYDSNLSSTLSKKHTLSENSRKKMLSNLGNEANRVFKV